MEKYRYRISLEVILEAKDEEQAEVKFEDLDLGDLDREQKNKNIDSYDYIDTDCINKVNPDGTIGKEI